MRHPYLHFVLLYLPRISRPAASELARALSIHVCKPRCRDAAARATRHKASSLPAAAFVHSPVVCLMLVSHDLQVTLRFSVEQKLVLVQLRLKRGQDARVVLQALCAKEAVPVYLEGALASALAALLRLDYGSFPFALIRTCGVPPSTQPAAAAAAL